MAFKVRRETTDFDRLNRILVQSKMQVENNPLYQTIKELLKLSQLDADDLATLRSEITEANIPSNADISSQTFITVTNETGTLPNSRILVAGDYVAIDTSVAGQIIVSSSEWSVLTDGDPIEPELIFASGDVIMLHTP